VQSIQYRSVDSSGQFLAAPVTLSGPDNSGLKVTGKNYYQFNWQTNSLTAGYYEIIVTLNDGTVQTIQIQLK
jgi:hypothetical protein